MTDKKEKPVYFNNFNLFKLKGIDSLKRIDKNQSVEVKYSNEFPVYIKYYKPERTVTLTLEDSFSVGYDNPIYVYSTNNFHGGKPGRNRVYTTHTEEYKDILYISLNDTIICKSYEVPASDNYDYALYLYLLNADSSIFKHQSGRNSEIDKGLSQNELYHIWLDSLKKGFVNYKHPRITAKELPE
ncbi:hypothetical protein [Flavisolibacter tropicus]|uniref:Uncharacterized protein n=1 Tax=Flavisolibacter tropicus TaxID=1492898 RepID=A0A172TW96_9BACT|nr:hypothetical protein [Flavisolibacter tropicus]ANE51381.1 hypothetical protein SY85_13560 [Flavisolibacter tropicus]